MIALLVLEAGFAAETTRAVDRLGELVSDPATALLTGGGPGRGFRIVALSNAAEATVRRAETGQWTFGQAHEALARIAATAADARFRPCALEGPYSDHNFYVTHWLVVLTALGQLDPLHQEVRRGPALARHLAERSLAHDDGIAPSFPTSPMRWPADQAATLYALSRADALYGLDLAKTPTARYRAAVTARPSTVDGLPVSEWTGQATLHDRPRGTAVAWSVRYLADVDPELAAAWWQAGRATFSDEALGFHGFREWPPGEDHPADRDSGPIVLGLSAAATAFAIGASRAMDDCATFTSLARTQTVVETLVLDPEATSGMSGAEALRDVQQSPVAAAIAANQRTVPSDCAGPSVAPMLPEHGERLGPL